MALAQDQEAFIAAYEAGTPQVLRQVLVGDCETPVAAFLKLRHATTGPAFLLESVEGGAVRGRYSMIGLEPDLIWRCHRGEAALCRPALGDGFLADPRPAFESLRALLDESAIPETDALADGDLPPMAAGVFGYLGYDMVRLMERLPEPKDTGTGVPDAILTRPTLMVVFDSVRDEIHVVTPVRHQPGVPARAAHERALERL
ncbi:MAG: anthranilate synthase component I, partial [Bosea sp. (in: a-proteobacteria)]|nr:anthranilate synthase component I [Bosea sp. (in: a-proteobacteria)]